MAAGRVPHHQFRLRIPGAPPSRVLSRPPRLRQNLRTGAGAHVL